MANFIDLKFVSSLLPKRDDNSNKGSFGKILNIAGSTQYPGAAYLSSISSLKLSEIYRRFLQNSINSLNVRRYFLAVVIDILLEVNMAEEDSKHGFTEAEVYPAVLEIAKFPHLRIKGLMTVAPYTENAEENRIYFRKMKQLLVDIKAKNIDNVFMETLSMGMSSDYEEAILCGSNLVRVGSAIFGPRIY